MTHTRMLECPKCFKAGELRHYRHIAGGVCFLCGGAGKVTERAASSWLAAQMRHDAPKSIGHTLPVTSEPDRTWKRIEVGGYVLDVAKGEGSEFHVRMYNDEVGWLPMIVVLHRGVVRPVRGTVCHGLEKHATRIATLLTERYKARSRSS